MTATDSPAIRIGAWRVDPTLDEISKDGNSVKLERRAMQLLVFMSKHADQVVSVEQLLDEVWAGVVVTPDSVYQAVSALRRVLGDDSHDPTYIATVPRRGYRLIAPVAPWMDVPLMPGENPEALPVDRAPTTFAVTKTGLARRLILVVVSVAFALAVGYVVVDRGRLPKHARTAEHPPPGTSTVVDDKSIAVLPFADMSEKKDQEYFADGMAEDIIDLLTKIPELHVSARTSSFYFKGKQTPIRDIAKALGVANLLEGSVRKSGDKLRVTAQLIRVDSGYHVWSETYDRKLDDIFRVQDEIAGEVVRALKVSLGDSNMPRVVATRNSEAYALLLQARFFANRQTEEDLTRAVSYYRQVVQLDPTSAAAWAELSETLTYIWNNGFLPQTQTLQQQRELALQAAEQAIAIDPNLGESHEALVEVRYWFDWNWAAAEAEVQKARALDPTSSGALTQAGGLAMLRGRSEDALRLWEQATVRDPLNADAYTYLALLHNVLGQYAESAVAARKAVDLSPGVPGSHLPLVWALVSLGQQDAALAEIAKESNPGYRAYERARTYAVIGRRADADAALAELERTFATEQTYDIATLHALRREPDQAFSWLDRAYKRHDPALIGIPAVTVEPDWASLRSDPRYKAFLRKMNLLD
jgi:TolB-like protein/DNA-binding winged helix-turn-helix (wHTH) protein/tetratricopeptide (TPR) repeat protein